jgi:hypothetical protein
MRQKRLRTRVSSSESVSFVGDFAAADGVSVSVATAEPLVWIGDTAAVGLFENFIGAHAIRPKASEPWLDQSCSGPRPTRRFVALLVIPAERLEAGGTRRRLRPSIGADDDELGFVETAGGKVAARRLDSQPSRRPYPG